MLTIAAPTRTSCMRSRYWRRNACQPGSVSGSASLFGPDSARRRSTSDASRPAPGSTSSRAQTSSGVSPCQATESRVAAAPGSALSSVTVIARSYVVRSGAAGGGGLVERLRIRSQTITPTTTATARMPNAIQPQSVVLVSSSVLLDATAAPAAAAAAGFTPVVVPAVVAAAATVWICVSVTVSVCVTVTAALVVTVCIGAV